MAQLFIGNIREQAVGRLDFGGFALTGIGFTGLIFGFEFLGRGVVPLPEALGLMAAGAVALAIYVRHAHHTPKPLLDLTLLKLPTFYAGVVGGFLFRVGIGAIPFLLPLMLQEGFGYNPLHSGLVTFVAAVGALVMKATAAPILRRFGFRRVLIWNATLSAVFLASYAFFRIDTPVVFILLLLLFGGFFRSLEFTSLNSISYADIRRERMSAATSFASMVQQLAASVGVGLGALLLHLAAVARGGTDVVSADFIPAFLAVALISAGSPLMFRKLAPDAGSELLGKRSVAVAEPEPRSQPS